MRVELTIARREFRGDKRLFAMSALTAAMAAALLSATLSLADLFQGAFERESRALLGGDVALRLSQREFNSDEVEWLRNKHAQKPRASTAARALAAAKRQTRASPGLSPSTNITPSPGKSVCGDQAYSHNLIAGKNLDGTWPALVAPGLMEVLEIEVGDDFSVAGLNLKAAAVFVREPDPDRRLWFGAPLVMVSDDAMRESGLLGPGGVVERHLRALIPENETPHEWRERLDEAFPDHDWRARTPDQAAGGARRFIERMQKFSGAGVACRDAGCRRRRRRRGFGVSARPNARRRGF